jgi:hypothetical protein
MFQLIFGITRQGVFLFDMGSLAVSIWVLKEAVLVRRIGFVESVLSVLQCVARKGSHISYRFALLCIEYYQPYGFDLKIIKLMLDIS